MTCITGDVEISAAVELIELFLSKTIWATRLLRFLLMYLARLLSPGLL